MRRGQKGHGYRRRGAGRETTIWRAWDVEERSRDIALDRIVTVCVRVDG